MMSDVGVKKQTQSFGAFLYEKTAFFFNLVRYAGWRTAFLRIKLFLLYFLPTTKYREIRNSPYYDRKWYLRTYLGTENPCIDPLRHFMEAGWRYGHCPSEYFPLTVYLFFHPELLEQNKCPLADFIEKQYPQEYLTELCRRFDGELERVRRSLKWARGIPPAPDAEMHLPRKIGIHLHCFYPAMLPEIVGRLKKMPAPFDLFISVPEGKAAEAVSAFDFASELPQMEKCVICHTPNRGRDLAPLICTFGENLAGYDYVCHIHTKHSPHLRNGGLWQNFLLEHLFGDEAWLRRIIAMLEQGTSILYARDFLVSPNPSGWGKNLIPAQAFLNKIGKKIDLRTQFPVIEFPQGSMFWARGEAIADFLNLELSYEDFPEEPVGTDGSLAHVLEHLFLILTAEKSSSVFQIYLPEEAADIPEKRYQYKKLPHPCR